MMTTTGGSGTAAGALRARAEAVLQQRASTSGDEATLQRVLHELQVHQIELELQNEELMQARAGLEQLVQERTAALARALRRAEEANGAKSRFLATMSHEIRTPLNGILGWSDLLLQDEDRPQRREQLEQVVGASRHLLAILNDILDVSKIEAGALRLHEDVFSLAAVLRAVQATFDAPLRARGLRYATSWDDVPAFLVGDERRLTQALANFVGNAVKFTAQGGIDVRVVVVEERGDSLLLRFEVQDTGIGIARDQLSRLFRPFEQLDDSITRRSGGTGLGLAINRNLARLMGGDVGVTSESGHGSTFWMTARMRRAAPATTTSTTTSTATGVATPAALALLQADHDATPVLLVEDEPISRAVAGMMLRRAGLQVDLATDGATAIELATQHPYALIVMDLQMPQMDGAQATRIIRTLPGHGRTPIVALTAHAFDDDRRACLEAGMDDHLAKTVTPDALYPLLLHWLRLRPRRTA